MNEYHFCSKCALIVDSTREGVIELDINDCGDCSLSLSHNSCAASPLLKIRVPLLHRVTRVTRKVRQLYEMSGKLVEFEAIMEIEEDERTQKGISLPSPKKENKPGYCASCREDFESISNLGSIHYRGDWFCPPCAIDEVKMESLLRKGIKSKLKVLSVEEIMDKLNKVLEELKNGQQISRDNTERENSGGLPGSGGNGGQEGGRCRYGRVAKWLPKPNGSNDYHPGE